MKKAQTWLAIISGTVLILAGLTFFLPSVEPYAVIQTAPLGDGTLTVQLVPLGENADMKMLLSDNTGQLYGHFICLFAGILMLFANRKRVIALIGFLMSVIGAITIAFEPYFFAKAYPNAYPGITVEYHYTGWTIISIILAVIGAVFAFIIIIRQLNTRAKNGSF